MVIWMWYPTSILKVRKPKLCLSTRSLSKIFSSTILKGFFSWGWQLRKWAQWPQHNSRIFIHPLQTLFLHLLTRSNNTPKLRSRNNSTAANCLNWTWTPVLTSHPTFQPHSPLLIWPRSKMKYSKNFRKDPAFSVNKICTHTKDWVARTNLATVKR